MSRVVDTFECEIPIEEIPKSLICTTYDGHMLEIDVNRFNGRVYVKYPRAKESLLLVSRIFQLLDLAGFIDALVIAPEKLLDADIVVADNPIEACEIRRDITDE